MTITPTQPRVEPGVVSVVSNDLMARIAARAAALPTPPHGLAAEALDHPFRYQFAMAPARLRYRVFGLRRDGSSRGEHRIRHVGHTSATAARSLGTGARHAALWLVNTPLELLLDSDGPDLPDRSEVMLVSGLPGTAAVVLADALRAAGPDGPWSPWLVWSRHRVALVGIGGTTPSDVVCLWSGEGPTMPTIDTTTGLLRWPDGSTIRMRLGPERRDVLRTQSTV